MASRYQPINRPQSSGPMLIERLVAAGSYITMGLIGFVWLLIGILTKNTLKPYLQYHIFQSIFISFAYFVLCIIAGLLLNGLSIIPLVNQVVMQITLFLNMPLIFSFSLIQVTIYAVIIYLVATSIQGQYSYLPWVSNIIKANLRNS